MESSSNGSLGPDTQTIPVKRDAPTQKVPVWRGGGTMRDVPVRYKIREDDKGRFLICKDAPNIAVRIDRGLSLSAAAARKYPECSIFVDGVVSSAPFMDVQRRIYNLDHHEGCVRAFTLAACEQATVVVLKGLDLGAERWTVYSNEPDLDAVLAIWVLLNHLRLSDENSSIWRRVMPLVRLQGVIDAHGFELKELSAFPEELQLQTQAAIEALRLSETKLKEAGKWAAKDPLEHTLEVLAAIDELIYTVDDLGVDPNVDEFVRSPLVGDRIVLGCRTDLGIYELEQHLKSVHGDRIGVIVLQKARTAYTLRQVDPFLPHSLEPLYDRLNQVDPKISPTQRWGGAADIGGSPRATGSGLSGQQIVDVCTWVHRPPVPGRRLGLVAIAALCPAALLWLVLAAVLRGVPSASVAGGLTATTATGFGVFSLLVTAIALAALLVAARSDGGRHGLRAPAGWGWLALLPVTILAALGGGAWVPLWLVAPARAPDGLGWAFLAVILVGVVGVEMLFRGVAHGMLVSVFNIQHPGGRHFLSVPNGVVAVAYALGMILLFAPPNWMSPLSASVDVIGWIVSPVLLGLVCGYGRERWGSLAVPLVLHIVTVLTMWLIAPIFG